MCISWDNRFHRLWLWQNRLPKVWVEICHSISRWLLIRRMHSVRLQLKRTDPKTLQRIIFRKFERKNDDYHQKAQIPKTPIWAKVPQCEESPRHNRILCFIWRPNPEKILGHPQIQRWNQSNAKIYRI
jgi:hypothetical protein